MKTFLLLICLPAFALSQDVQLLLPGEYDLTDVNAKTGEQWMGLLQTVSGYELIPAKINVEDTDSKTMVTFPIKGRIITLVKGAGLEAGVVTNLPFKEGFMYPGMEHFFKLGKNRYTLKATGTALAKPFQFENYQYVLITGGKEYVIQKVITMDDALPVPIWAGDLDRDGKLDLILQHRAKYSSQNFALYLSSFSEEGQAVKKVAEFTRAIAR